MWPRPRIPRRRLRLPLGVLLYLLCGLCSRGVWPVSRQRKDVLDGRGDVWAAGHFHRCRIADAGASPSAHLVVHWLQRVGFGNSGRSEEHTAELLSLMRISYAVLWLKQKITDPMTIISFT